jgi:hypothetical protein
MPRPQADVFIQQDAGLGIAQQSRQRSVALHAAELHEKDRANRVFAHARPEFAITSISTP